MQQQSLQPHTPTLSPHYQLSVPGSASDVHSSFPFSPGLLLDFILITVHQLLLLCSAPLSNECHFFSYHLLLSGPKLTFCMRSYLSLAPRFLMGTDQQQQLE